MINSENANTTIVDEIESAREETQGQTVVGKQPKKWKEQTDALAKKEEDLDRRMASLKTKEQEIAAREAAVLEIENKVSEAERMQESVLAKEKFERKKALDAEMFQERTAAFEKISKMISARREELEEVLSSEIESRRKRAEKEAEEMRNRAQADADRIRKEAEAEAEERRIRLKAQTDVEIAGKTQEIDSRETKLNAAIGEYEKKLADLEEAQKKAEEAKAAADRQLRRNERREAAIESRESDLDRLIDERWGHKVTEYQEIIREKEKALEELRNRAGELRQSVDVIESFKASIGDEPVIIQGRIANLQKEKDRLEKELAARAPMETQRELDELKRMYGDLKQDNDTLRQENAAMKKSQEEIDTVRVENHRMESLNGELQSQVEELEGRVARYEDRIKRLSAAETRAADREARIAEVQSGYTEGFSVARVDQDKQRIPYPLYEGEESAWLDHIGQQCDKYGISFPKRILYAFHTALKISDWSIIAVLAGVSGTGKSELPKLYAAFGGMNFISVPVQPSWDSQESMLGYFNSIDNRFEPEPLLKYLVQCTEDEDYNSYMSIVLLDEMNLAHVEHYFAEFLSKLETRRGTAKRVPNVEVKLGAGVEPYKLQLKRNILWTGTMNQDETTKSLSDKVLDRGLVIYFPRPHTLLSRTSIKNLAAMIKDRPMMTQAKWSSWIVRNLITKVNEKSPLLAELDKYREIVEEINNILEKVGRALGHRVWQSIMNYMLNYPTVSEILRMNGMHDERKNTWNLDSVEVTEELKNSMRIAFEDQIVQKIMPKLRGIETRGKGREHLQEIEDLLESKGFEKLKDDFEIACTQGYGQFMWCSAKYIEVDDVQTEEQPDTEDET